MKKILALLIVVALLGISLSAFADTDRDIPRKFRAFTANTGGLQSCVIYRITGVATASPGVYGIYNTDSLKTAALTVCATEGGTATSGDQLEMYDFGDEGLNLNAGLTVIVSGCTIVIEYR